MRLWGSGVEGVAEGTEDILWLARGVVFVVEVAPLGGTVLVVHEFLEFGIEFVLFLNELGDLIFCLELVLHTLLCLRGVFGMQLRQLVLILESGQLVYVLYSAQQLHLLLIVGVSIFGPASGRGSTHSRCAACI